MITLPPYDAILATAIIEEMAKTYKTSKNKIRVTNSAINDFMPQFAMGYPVFVVEVAKSKDSPMFFEVGVSNTEMNFVCCIKAHQTEHSVLLVGDELFEQYDAAFSKAFEHLKGKRLQTMQKMREGSWWTSRRPHDQLTAGEQQESRNYFRIRDSLLSEALTVLERGDKVQFEFEDKILQGKFLAIFQEERGLRKEWVAKVRKGNYDYFPYLGQVEALSESS